MPDEDKLQAVYEQFEACMKSGVVIGVDEVGHFFFTRRADDEPTLPPELINSLQAAPADESEKPVVDAPADRAAPPPDDEPCIPVGLQTATVNELWEELRTRAECSLFVADLRCKGTDETDTRVLSYGTIPHLHGLAVYALATVEDSMERHIKVSQDMRYSTDDDEGDTP